jgi:hypothetical protein
MRSQLAELNVLTLTEPWASLVVDGEKEWETRYWPTRYRGQLLIQAAKGFPSDARAVCYEEPFKSALTRRQNLDDYRRSMLFYDPVEFLWKDCGKIIGVVSLVDTARTEKVREALEAVGNSRALQELQFGGYADGRWAFRFEKPRRFNEPVPVRGALGIWGLTDPLPVDQVKNQLSMEATI